MSRVLAVDPGFEGSAFVVFDGDQVVAHAQLTNPALLRYLRDLPPHAVDAIVFEQIESFGMAVGREVFETVFWTGRLFEAAHAVSAAVDRLPRRAVKLHLCQSARATDSNIRQALKDRFGGSAAIGTKRAPGPLWGIKSHEWAALAVAVVWWDQQLARGAA